MAPKFDIVRVSPSGSMVIAGRAEPEATVILRANGREIGRVRADVQGQWAFAGAASLPPGAHEITLAALDPAGREIAGTGAVEAVVAAPAPPQAAPAAVAQAPSAPAAPIVVLTTPQGAPTLLQAPGRPAGGARLGLDIVDYDAAGDIRFAGTAPAGATIRLYVDDAHVGDAIVGPDGRWSLAPTGAVAQGEHRLRLDQVDQAGRVAARVEQPFQRAAVAALDAGVQRVVVQPRQNLWRIARRAYGQGVRYTEIYAANRDVISDPARIYPGQVFAIPGAAASGTAAGGSTPASASRSR
jgi:nucleoid-associated protein YgaU